MKGVRFGFLCKEDERNEKDTELESLFGLKKSISSFRILGQIKQKKYTVYVVGVVAYITYAAA